jgi:hypothetical protein
VTSPVSKIDSSRLYYYEKSENLLSCSLIQYVGSIMTKAKMPNVNNGLDTSQNKAVSLSG